jgi:hypothetical protein
MPQGDDGKDQNQYPAYALKSDDGKNRTNQYPAYAVKSDDGERPELKPGQLTYYSKAPQRSKRHS